MGRLRHHLQRPEFVSRFRGVACLPFRNGKPSEMENRMRSLVMAVLAVSGVALAQPHGGPPPEALTACSGLSAGAACGFTHHGQNLTGTCRAGPNGEALACAPPHFGKGPGGPRTPPPEALAACSGQSEGASCSFSIGDKALTGTCKAPPDGSAALACKPPHPPHRGPPPEALAACASSTAGASCSVTFNGQTLSGTCVAGPGGEALACLPPRP